MSRSYTDVGAVVSDCGQYRYRLWRRWDDSFGVLLFIMLNPSTADGTQDDPTIRKCVGFAERAGYGGIEVVNLFAYRATDPKALKAAGYPEGPDNLRHLKAVLNQYHDSVVCAWGANGAAKAARPAVLQLESLMLQEYVSPWVLALTSKCVPQHPLMLPYDREWGHYPFNVSSLGATK